MKATAFAIGLGMLLVVSSCFNFALYTNYSPGLKEKRFFDKHAGDIDMLVFENGGGIMEGVVLDEDDQSVLLRFVEGTTQFKKSQVKKILYDINKKKGEDQ